MVACSRVVGAAIAALTALSGVAHADILLGGPLYGGPTEIGGVVICRLFNGGTQTVTVATRQIWNNTGSLVPLSQGSDSCNVAMGAGKSCEYHAVISAKLAFSCRAITNGIDNNVSGMIEIQDSSLNVLFTAPLRK